MPALRIAPFLLIAVTVLLGACGSSGIGLPRAGTTVSGDSGQSASTPRNRYSLNNQCFALKSKSAGLYVTAKGSGYAASAGKLSDAEAFYLKPTALGQYLLYNRAEKLLLAGTPVATQDLAAATDDAIFTVKLRGDTTVYPAAPRYDVEPVLAELNAYRNFVDPNLLGTDFTLTAHNGQRLAIGGDGTLGLAAAAEAATQQFVFEPLTAASCKTFPEAQDNTENATFKGTYKDSVTGEEQVLGMADVHVHMSSSTFLGGAFHGAPFHKFGITHALPDCDGNHGPNGLRDILAAAYEGDTDGHATDGWPVFTDWPSRDSLTHHAIYWKWIERAWKGGLRIAVNDMVENETLCELQRSESGEPLKDCNEMKSARRQINTTYAMQDYIDAQYGGRGAGFYQVVLSPAEARSKIAEGKLAVVIGLEISNTLNCRVTYNPLRQQEPWQETGTGPTENRYGCSMSETDANGIRPQLLNLKALGVRQMITIHEFDNAFGGNGIFNDLVLNLGNRENSGGIPSGTVNSVFQTEQETPTGEFWTTYACPTNDDKTKGFSGYLWGNSGGATLQGVCTPFGQMPAEFEPLRANLISICTMGYAGQGGRPGGTLPVYPQSNQCNARWLTPIGQYLYEQMMKEGIIFDVDHLEMAMKTQALNLAEAQTIDYPFVSTHGTFGGMTNDQAARVLKNKGHLYPSIGSVGGFLNDLRETRTLSQAVGNPHLFGFGFGTDTDGMSGQQGPRGEAARKARPLTYPFSLFDAAFFSSIGVVPVQTPTAVKFNQPKEPDYKGAIGHAWHQDEDGNAHYGMMSDFVREMQLEGSPQDMRDLFNSAEVYLRTWERTLEASAEINRAGLKAPAQPILRAAPKPGDDFSTYGYQ